MKVFLVTAIILFLMTCCDISLSIAKVGRKSKENSRRVVLDNLSTRLRVPVYLEESASVCGYRTAGMELHYVFKYADMMCYVVVTSETLADIKEILWKERGRLHWIVT